MNLNNFVSYIDRVIYLRGDDYYENGHVKFVKETEANVYVAKVEGTETYTVNVKLDDSLNIVETLCDCPYDIGQFCKHQVAVFLALQEIKNCESEERIFKGKQSSNKEQEVGSPKGGEDYELDIEQILSARTKEELIDFLVEISYEYKEVTQRIMLEFANGDNEEELLKAASLIHTYINNSSDRHGFVDYMNTDNAVYGAELVLEKAGVAIDEDNVLHAVNLILCAIREMVDLIQDADDSGGTIGAVIDNGFSCIDEIIENEEFSASEEIIIFENLMKEASHRRYDGWTDWRFNYLESASKLSDTTELRNRLETYITIFLSKEDVNSWSGNYFAEKVHQIRYNMILHNDGEEKAMDFIEQNLQFSGFREMAIERAMQNKDYEHVIKLALDGEAKDKNMRGLVNKWKGYRYNAYKLSGKLDEQRVVAMDFIMDGSFNYYKELKNTYGKDEWAEIYLKIILSLGSQNINISNIYTDILIEEGEKEKLLDYVKNRPSSVESYYKHLIPEFKEEVYELFIKYIEQTASRASNRKSYQGVCAIIRNLKKAGGKEQALEITQKLYNIYAKRPAFRDELTRVLRKDG